MRLTPGRMWLLTHQRLSRGLRVAYWRDIVRPRILRTAPIHETTDTTCEIHILTSQDDWLNSIWTLKSFYRASQRRYALCIHDDGTLNAQAVRQLAMHFPDARFIPREQADRELARELESFPRCARFRETNLFAPRLFDFPHYLQSNRMLILDSDLLFFNEPRELLRRIDDPNYVKNCANRDVQTAYTITSEAASAVEVTLIDRFNAGLSLIHRDSLRLEWIEEFLGLPDILGYFWRIEQTIFALLSSRHGVELLPEAYDIRLDSDRTDAPVRHYVGAIRHLMYRDGIRRLVREGLLQEHT